MLFAFSKLSLILGDLDTEDRVLVVLALAEHRNDQPGEILFLRYDLVFQF